MALSRLKCEIAGLRVCISVLTPQNRLLSQAQCYLSDFNSEPDFNIEFTEEFLKRRATETPGLSLHEAEYIWSGYEFCRRLLAYDGLVLHASAISYKGKAYLFSAPSGTGKSTHTAIWEKVFGKEAEIINDDKPALRLRNGKIYVCGTPWSGKTDKNKNISVPLGGICFISRSPYNHIEKADKKIALASLLGQTLRYPSSEYMTLLLDFLNENLTAIPVYKMGCNMEDEAAIIAYEFMKKHCEGDRFYEN